MSDLSPKQVRAARALLAWSQADLAAAAKVAVSTVADFERGGRTPVTNNAQAIRDALVGEGIRFEAGGAIIRSLAAPTAPSAPGRPFRWITASDLADWAGRRDGPAGLPDLLSRLILVSVGPVTMRFPSDESIQHAGWDGYCSSPIENDFVPAGQSVWELGAQRQGIAQKAEEDYRKRSERPLGFEPGETTYVFVTPHRWPQKDEWASEKKRDGLWKDVRVLDGDVLVHWLERHPAVAEWLASRIGKRPAGLAGLKERWQQWSLATNPPLLPALMLADRDDEAARLLKWLYGPAGHFSVQAESADEATAFLYAALSLLPDPYLTYWLSRIVVAETDRAAVEIAPLGAKLTIVLPGGDPGLAQRLVASGHHVFSAHGSEAGAPIDVLRLPRPWTHSIERAFSDTSLGEMEARQISRAAGRSLAIVRRLLPAGAAPRPSWAMPPTSPALIAAILAGAWNPDYPVDRQILARLSGMDYDALEAELAPLAEALNGPLRRSGSLWKLASLRDSWFLFAGHFTRARVDELLKAFHDVLTDPDPAYDDPDRPWRLSREPPSRASAELRRGLTEAVIALGVYGERVTGVPDAVSLADRAVRQLFKGADEQRWWSLSGDFRRLAEASPDAFLTAIDDGLNDSSQAIMVLFRSDKGYIHAQEYLSDLLWALELLAWSPDHVGSAALLLARLAEIDPGGKVSNRPPESLRRIFLPWRPQTVANHKARIQLVEKILALYPKSGWNLILAISPDHRGGTTHSTATPHWRVFEVDAPEPITNQSLFAAYSKVGDLLLEHVGVSAERWSVLLDRWPSFPPEWRSQAASALAAAVVHFSADERRALRETLRAFLSKHERFATSDWAISAEERIPLGEIFVSLESGSLLDRHRWLFDTANRNFDPNVGWRESLERLEGAQRQAVEEIASGLKSFDILDYSRSVQRPYALGHAVGSSSIAMDQKQAMLEVAIVGLDEAADQVSRGMLAGMTGLEGQPWLEQLFERWVGEGRSAEQLSRLALVLNVDPTTWTLVAGAGPAVEQAYWRRLSVFAIPKDADPAVFVGKLLEVGRGRAALEFIGGHGDVAVPADLIFSVLRDSSTIRPGEEESFDSTMFTYYVGEVFKRLDKEAVVDEAALVELEWTFFQALQDSERPPRLLHKALADDPAFFVSLIKILYRADNEEPRKLEGEEAEAAQVLASQAFNVLESWAHVPGTNADGTINGAALEAWVKQARLLLAGVKRVDIGDFKIGEILSAVPRRDGEGWPPEAVRDLIEISRSRELESGLEVGLYNRRGVTSRLPMDGGEQERELAARYRSDARAAALQWPRTRAVLERIAEHYERDGQRYDQDAEQRDWL